MCACVLSVKCMRACRQVSCCGGSGEVAGAWMVSHLAMGAVTMTTLSLRPAGQCNGSCLLAPATARQPRISWWRRQQRQTTLHRQQMQQCSVATLHNDKVDDRLGKNPCNFHPSIWGDFFLHYYDAAAASSKQQVFISFYT